MLIYTIINHVTLVVSLAIYFFLHSLLANQKIKMRIVKMGMPYNWYRIAYNSIAIITLLPVVYTYTLCSKSTLLPFPGWVFFIGILLEFTGMILLILSLKQYRLEEFMGLEQLSRKQVQGQDHLVTSGLNAWVRHPLYFASLLILWGWWLTAPSPAVSLIVVISTIYLKIGSILEEQKLVNTFGKAYEVYRQKVRNGIIWIPGRNK